MVVVVLPAMANLLLPPMLPEPCARGTPGASVALATRPAMTSAKTAEWDVRSGRKLSVVPGQVNRICRRELHPVSWRRKRRSVCAAVDKSVDKVADGAGR